MKPKGLDIFIDMIRLRYPIMSSCLIDLNEFIINSGCKSIRFEEMSNKSLGISKTDECVLSNTVIKVHKEYMMYVILHEVSHQYQYKKHGKNISLDIYNGDITIKKAAEKLLFLEKAADRLAIKKLKSIFRSNNIPMDIDPIPRYLNLTNTEYLEKYLSGIRDDVKKHNLLSIEDINNYVHSTLV